MMRPLGCTNPAGPLRNQGGPDPLEMLQTDVMRFFAIIALCLVAVFALVQSLSLVPEHSGQPEQKALQAEQHKSKEYQAKIQKQQQELQRTNQELHILRQRLVQARKTLEQKTLAAATSTQKEPGQEPFKAQTPSKRAAQSKAPEPGRQQTGQAKAASEPKGFSLFFASDQVLKDLIIKGEIGFYAMTGSGTYLAVFSSGELMFKQATKPRQFHEMAPDTVPEIYHRSFRQLGTTQRVTWGVTLPHKTRRSLQAAMAGRTGGRLVIQADGRVHLRD